MPPGRRGKRAKKAPIPRESGGSSIDSLPDRVLQHILGFLPARDAVRSCVLAQRWRDLWMFATGLRIIGNGDDDDDMNELRKFVDHLLLLLLRGLAPLETFELRFTDINMADTLSDDDILRLNLWFQHAVRYQARVLRSVVREPEYSFDLNVVHLVSRHLTQLELVGVQVKENFLNLCDCPALERLELGSCDLTLVKKISSESLKRLNATNCGFNESIRTRIHAPSLPFLEKLGSYIPAQKTNAISEHLKIVVVKCDVVDEKVCRVLKLLSTFNIRKLTSNSIKFLSIPKVLAPGS